VRKVVHAFVLSECEEAEMRGALDDAAPFYRDAPEAREVRRSFQQVVINFMGEVLPDASTFERMLAADVIMMSMSAFGKRLSEADYTSDEVDARASALGDMLCAYIESLAARQGG